MTQPSLLSDDLVRRLIGVGQVDVVVGLPTLNHQDTIADTLAVVDQGLQQYFPRARTVVICADGGSNDRTLEIAGDGAASSEGARTGLRSRHRIAAPYRGDQGRAGAIRLVFTAAELLQAQAVAVCDPDAVGFSPEWIGALLEPVSRGTVDVVAGAPQRHPLEGLLVTQLIRPVMHAVYGRQFEQPLLAAFGCSGRFSSDCLAQDAWDRSPIREGIDVWLAAAAVAGDYRAGQVFFGRTAGPPRPGPSLQAVFGPLVGALFTTLDRHASRWTRAEASVPATVTTLGARPPLDTDGPTPHVSRLGSGFVQDLRDLRPVLEQILSPDTLSALSAIADERSHGARYDDEAWVATVYDFAAAHHHDVIDRSHIVRALMPLYLGRVASFIGEHAESPVADAERHLEELSRLFDERRPYLVERWRRTS